VTRPARSEERLVYDHAAWHLRAIGVTVPDFRLEETARTHVHARETAPVGSAGGRPAVTEHPDTTDPVTSLTHLPTTLRERIIRGMTATERQIAFRIDDTGDELSKALAARTPPPQHTVATDELMRAAG
jgi:hypothetical protein